MFNCKQHEPIDTSKQIRIDALMERQFRQLSHCRPEVTRRLVRGRPRLRKLFHLKGGIKSDAAHGIVGGIENKSYRLKKGGYL